MKGSTKLTRHMRTIPHFGVSAFLPLGIILLIVTSSPSVADDPDNCLLCHQFRGLARFDAETSEFHLFYTNPDYTFRRLGPHARLACTACHERSEVTTIPHAPVSKVDCTRQCHLANPTGFERTFSHAHVVDLLKRSSHTPELLDDLKFQDGPLLNEGQSRCLYCHDEPLFRDPSDAIPRFRELTGKVFDRCDVCHSQTVPADIEYYVRHIASRFEPARKTLETAQVCSVCHSDPLIQQEYNLPDSVVSYVRSFHGKAALLGDQSTANCIDCHVRAGENVHLMLGPNDPLSAVHANNLADGCRSTACHPGADPRIADAAMHLNLPTAHGSLEFGIAALFIILTVLTFGPSAAIVMLELVHNILGKAAHVNHRMKGLILAIMNHPRGRERLTRFAVRHRVSHWILSILFTLLVLTGFPLKFAETQWASTLVRMFGGLSVARGLHHWAGLLLVVGFLVHMLDVFIVFLRRATQIKPSSGRNRFVEAWVNLPMWITFDDVKKTLELFAHLLFLRKERPTFGRFSPTEKFEYLGVFWGTMLLGITGAMLWGEQVSSRFLSGRASNIATIAHTYEAFLALIHVGILHIYNVVLAPKVFPLSMATLTGETPQAKLEEEHGEMIEQVARDLGVEGPLGKHD